MPRLTPPRPFLFALILGLTIPLVGGCRSSAHPADPTAGSLPAPPSPTASSQPASLPPAWVEAVRADCAPPVGWSAEPLKKTEKSQHQVWISPSGSTAYGVLNVRHFLMSLASNDRILSEFVTGMKATEGSADLLEQSNDPTLAGGVGGLRFVARGGRYTVRADLVSRGQYAWIWYAGTLTGKPVIEAELKVAEAARDRTIIEAAKKR
ncbi:MAG: hypothetical protein JWO31_3084 [Phycisphaerales bacterium]|nr:hypothetical protein [Phycisphaerales bacterium]